MACKVVEQIDFRSVCAKVVAQAAGVGFLDTKREGFARLPVSTVATRAGIEGSIAVKDLYYIKLLKMITDNSTGEITGELSSKEIDVQRGEYRFVFQVKANYDVWNQMDAYDSFTDGEAFFYYVDDTTTFISDGETVPDAYGLPLGRVKVLNPPIVNNGSDPSIFTMAINIDANSLKGISSTALDFPISTIDPVATV